MNIFAISNDPKECALALDDKRLIKMCLETAQLISTSINEMGSKGFYKTTHKNHPCAIWARQNASNYEWLCQYFKELCEEYSHRFLKQHKCSEYLNISYSHINKFPHNKLTAFSNCAANLDKGISFKHVENTHDAYKMYLNARWKTDVRLPRWTNRQKPIWCEVIYSG